MRDFESCHVISLCSSHMSTNKDTPLDVIIHFLKVGHLTEMPRKRGTMNRGNEHILAVPSLPTERQLSSFQNT